MRLFKVITLSLLIAQAYAGEQLVFAVDVIRHGARTPVADIKIPAYVWPEGIGELTPQGMQQEFQLGQRFRALYVDQYHLLAPHYSSSQMYVRSSDIDRTLMSAQCALLGLYPLGTGPNVAKDQPALPSGFQPIPIHTDEHKLDPFFKGPVAKLQKKLAAQYVYSQKAWRARQAELQPHFAAWSQATGVKIKNLQDLISVADALYIRQQNQVPLPAQLSQQDVSTIIDNGFWAFSELYAAQAIGQANTDKLLKQIDSYMRAAQKNQTPLKFVLFSAHDDTIMGLLSALKAPVLTHVPYSSDLKFMLFKDNHDYYVKISLNGTPVQLSECQVDHCTLEQFNKMAKD